MGVPVEYQTGRESDIPKNVTLELTRKCPLNCLMCSSNGGLPHPRELSLPKWMEIIDELMDLGAESFFLSGGEPFSYSYFKDICNYISKLDVSLSIYSSGNCIKNGELLPLSQNDIKFLSSLNLKNIIFSLEGSNEITHDKITTVNGSFQNTLTSIKHALNQKVITELHFVPMLINYKELPMVIALAKKLGISRVSVLRYVDQGRGKKNSSHLKLGNEEIKQLRAILSEIDTSYVRLGHPLNPYLISNNSKCTAGRDRITVRYDGLVFPCEAMKFLADRYHDNDVNVRPIEEIWKNSAIFNLARNLSLDLPSECLNCNSLAKCGGGCPAQRLNEGSIGHLDAFCLHNLPDNLLKII
jgi:radical SAM protein with 4Fe4S-binding SPASM domain